MNIIKAHLCVCLPITREFDPKVCVCVCARYLPSRAHKLCQIQWIVFQIWKIIRLKVFLLRRPSNSYDLHCRNKDLSILWKNFFLSRWFVWETNNVMTTFCSLKKLAELSRNCVNIVQKSTKLFFFSKKVLRKSLWFEQKST